MPPGHTHRKHPHTRPIRQLSRIYGYRSGLWFLFLTFNLAVAFFASPGSPPPNHKNHHIQIWRVTLALDDQQHGIGLTAVHLVSFPLEPAIIRVFALFILGPRLALSFFSFSRRRCRQFTFIIYWKRVDDETNYPRHFTLHSSGEEPVCRGFPRNFHLRLWPDRRSIYCLATNYSLLRLRRPWSLTSNFYGIPETTSFPPFDFINSSAMSYGENLFGRDHRELSLSKPFFLFARTQYGFPSVCGMSYIEWSLSILTVKAQRNLWPKFWESSTKSTSRDYIIIRYIDITKRLLSQQRAPTYTVTHFWKTTMIHRL